MMEGRETTPPPIPAETARLFQNIFFWSFFLSQGSETAQNSLFRYACLAGPSLAGVLPHIECVGADVTYSTSFVQDIIQPAIERIEKYITRSGHKKIDHTLVLREIMGRDPETNFGHGRDRGVLDEFVQRIDAAQKDQTAKRRGLMEEQLGIVAKNILSQDYKWVSDGRKVKGGRVSTGPFNDAHFSHVCHYGFLKQPLPRDCPNVFQEIFCKFPATLIKHACADEKVSNELRTIVKVHNKVHPTQMISLPFV